MVNNLACKNLVSRAESARHSTAERWDVRSTVKVHACPEINRCEKVVCFGSRINVNGARVDFVSHAAVFVIELWALVIAGKQEKSCSTTGGGRDEPK